MLENRLATVTGIASELDTSYGPVKGKVVTVLFQTEHHAMKVYWGNEGTAPRIV
jgi:hypothetical protein